MYELQAQVVNATLNSREVASMMEIDHYELLKKVDGTTRADGTVKQVGIIPTLTKGNFPVSDYFILSSYKDDSGKENKCYEVTKKGCEMLAHKMIGEKGIIFTAKYIERFHTMEDYIKANQKQDSYLIEDPIERAKAWIKEQEEKKAIEEKNRMLMHSAKLYTTTEVAKELNMKSARALNKLLADMHIQYKQNNTWVPYSEYADKGYTSIKQIILDNGTITYDRRWTQAGRDFILEQVNKYEET